MLRIWSGDTLCQYSGDCKHSALETENINILQVYQIHTSIPLIIPQDLQSELIFVRLTLSFWEESCAENKLPNSVLPILPSTEAEMSR